MTFIQNNYLKERAKDLNTNNNNEANVMNDFINSLNIDKSYSLFEELERKQEFTDTERQQANLFLDYLKRSGSNKELESFIDKALKNAIADTIRATRLKQQEAKQEAFNSSLPYKD